MKEYKYKLVIDEKFDNITTVIYSTKLEDLVELFEALEPVYTDSMFIVACKKEKEKC